MKKNRINIVYLIVGQLISVCGISILRFALSLYVLDTTGRADVFAVILAVSSIAVLFAPIGGAMADRFDRKVLMVMMDAANAVLALLLFLVVGMTESIFAIGLLLFLLSFVSSFDTPVVGASIPLLVEPQELEKINGLSNAILQLSRIAAPIIGGVLYGIFGAKLLIGSSIFFFVVAALIESLLNIPYEKHQQTGRVIQLLVADLKAGFADLKESRALFRVVLIVAAIDFSLGAFVVVGLPVIFRMGLQVDDTLYGIGMASFSLASILGAVFASRLTRNVRFDNFYRIFTITGLLLLFMGILVNLLRSDAGFWVVVGITFIIGVMVSAISVYLISLLQRVTPNENLGKMMATMTAVSQSAVPLGQFLIGALFKKSGTSMLLPIMAVGGFIALISFLCFVWFKQTKETDIYVVKRAG
ncbi:MFS transporter [Enterococcus florum]|uniref:MFS transporter n=1 Tax=Enterococcus florum TaxID=2480627 RepID=A0A4P5PCF7_9ENTE|nr:MFS transporter [Enterococcus florum]GCF94184.1 MFS transporter [Enterococcus florum]